MRSSTAAPATGFLLAALLFGSVPLPAQVGAHVIALDRGNGLNEPPKLWPVVDCKLRTKCDLPQLSVHANPRGGTTFDSTHDREWSSDGRMIISTSKTCAYYCGFRIPATMADVTGMGVNRSRGWLYTSHADNVVRIWTDDVTCGLKALGGCTVPGMQKGEVITGIEFDSRNDKTHPLGRLFCVTTFGYLVVLEEPTPALCKLICRVTLPSCSVGRFQTYSGLTYDPTRRYLIITDGKFLMTLEEQNSCQLRHVSCCLACVGNCYEFTGLAWDSGELWLDPRTKGCTDAICGCIPQIGGEGVPSVWNPSFRITLTGLPPKAVSVVLLALGDPTAGIPIFCGNFYLNPKPLLLTFPTAHTGTTACAAHAAVPMGFFPPETAGLHFAVQAATVCPSTKATGLAISAALRIEIGW